MHSTHETERAGLMAQWLATGGAAEAIPAGTPAGDDGLATTAMTGFDTGCFIDDGLQAAPTARGSYGCGFADDGLQAYLMSYNVACHADDGLKAAPTAAGAYGCGFADDGLKAYTPTLGHPGCAGG